MKVILLENVKRIGSIGEVIEVKRGYARNFLIANKKALYASKENISEVEKIKAESKRLGEIKILPASKVSSILEKKFNLKLKNTQSMRSLLKMSDIRYKDIQGLESFGDTMNSDIGHLVAIQERYEGYLKRQDQEVLNGLKTQNIKIPEKINVIGIK